ncbi:MAG: nitrilase-related carbon-nitrogen hydrolase [Methanobacteriota archaeon]
MTSVARHSAGRPIHLSIRENFLLERKIVATGGPDILRIALAQLRCAASPGENIASAKRAVRAAARRGADLCVLPELFTNRYLGQFHDALGRIAEVPDHAALVDEFRDLARDSTIALVVPFVERVDDGTCYNAVSLIDDHGKVRAHYRKTHIPDEEGYREDLYFRPGDLGYAVAPLGGVRVGLAICWDQWFPEVSRSLALRGAQLLVYPSAIGSEVVAPDYDSRPEWELVMRAQAVMNRVYVTAVNRVGQEERIRFYGGSFLADPWGHVVRRASTTRPETIHATVDLSQITRANSFFGFLRSRRPDTYGSLTEPTPVESDLKREAPR